MNDNEIDLNSIYNKYHKNITETDLLHKQKIKSSSQIKDKVYYQFINAILNDDKPQAEKILNTSQITAMINHVGIEGYSPIQYAALYGSLNCFKYLLFLKANTDLKVEMF